MGLLHARLKWLRYSGHRIQCEHGQDSLKVIVNTDQDPSTRKMRVLTIGAGLSGIQLAYQIQKHCENVEHVIYEKNHDIGGTWLENRYPGKTCGRISLHTD